MQHLSWHLDKLPNALWMWLKAKFSSAHTPQYLGLKFFFWYYNPENSILWNLCLVTTPSLSSASTWILLIHDDVCGNSKIMNCIKHFGIYCCWINIKKKYGLMWQTVAACFDRCSDCQQNHWIRERSKNVKAHVHFWSNSATCSWQSSNCLFRIRISFQGVLKITLVFLYSWPRKWETISASGQATNNSSQSTYCLKSKEGRGEIWLAVKLKYHQPLARITDYNLRNTPWNLEPFSFQIYTVWNKNINKHFVRRIWLVSCTFQSLSEVSTPNDLLISKWQLFMW